MGARDLGARIHNNAVNAASFEPLAALGAHVAANARAAADLSPITDFVAGLTSGRAAPKSTGAPGVLAQKAATSPFAGHVEVPGVGKVPVLSQEYMKAHPIEDLQAPPVARGGGKVAAASPFEAMASRYSQAAGGLSLNELAALSDSAYKTGVGRSTGRTPTTKDLVGLELKSMGDELFAAKMSQAQAAKQTNPAEAARLQSEAVKERMDLLKSILGANPVDLQTAASMGGTGDAE